MSEIGLFTFASRNFDNIRIGIEKRLWAVATVSDTAMKARKTKAKRYMSIGSKGLLYCNPIHAFTTPFEVRTEPDLDAIVDDVWPEAWAIPFGIEPLGDLSRVLHKDEAVKRWPFLAHRMQFENYKSVSAAMSFTGACVFTPSRITEQDWDMILDDLATRKS